VIGESEYFTRGTYPCSAQANGTSEVFSVNFEVFWGLVVRWGLVSKFKGSIILNSETLKARSTDARVQEMRFNLRNVNGGNRAVEMEKTVVHDDSNPDNTPSFLVEPTSLFYKSWKAGALCLVLYQSIVTPLLITFGQGVNGGVAEMDPVVYGFVVALDVICPFFFACDVAAHLFVFQCKHQGRLVSDPTQIRSLYMRGRMPVDIMSAFPLALIVARTPGGTSMSSFLRLFQLSRVVRLSEYLDVIIDAAGELMNYRAASTGVRRLANWAPLIVLLNHVVACFFYAVSRDVASDDTWIAWAMERCSLGEAPERDCGPADNYLQGFYWT
jgi:hypothetical protein